MAFVRARGVRFHVVDLGRGPGPGTAERPRREPLVMLHGLFTGSAASWYFTVAPALARRRRVRLLDWRGHGMSQRTPTGYDSATMVDDLAALTAELPPFAIAGHRYGAAVAVRFALAHPGRVTRLALLDPPFAAGPRAADPVTVALAGDAAAGSRDPRGRLRALLTQTSVLVDLAAEPPITGEELAALRALPVLAVVGSRSPFRPAADLVARALPAARRHVLAGGHDVHVTAGARLAPLLTEFLDEPGAEAYEDRLLEDDHA